MHGRGSLGTTWYYPAMLKESYGTEDKTQGFTFIQARLISLLELQPLTLSLYL